MSYADMITLLLCFFIIFVSVSEPKKDKFSLITDGLANKFGMVDISTPLQGVYSGLQATVENHQLYRDVAVEKSERSVQMEIASGNFFRPASAEVTPEKLPVLAEIAQALKSGMFLEYRVIIEGYTSDGALRSGAFPSNWELSSARASRLVRYFAEQGIDPSRMVAVGFGDAHPKVPNRDNGGKAIPENQAQNERVVIKFERAN